jgi:hypothetical protein
MIKHLVEQSNFIDATKLMHINSFKNKVRLYSIVGDNEQFIKLSNKYKSLNHFVEKEFLNTDGKIFSIITTELEGFSKLEFSIITSIGIGNTKPTAISNNINVKEILVRDSLENLKKQSIIRKELPIMDGFVNSEIDEIYFLKENYLTFYFNFIYPYLKNTNTFNATKALSHFKKIFEYQYQGRIYEEICKEFFLYSVKNNQFNWTPSTFGSYWNEDNSIEIDIISQDKTKNTLFIGECKFFKSKPVDMRIYHHLKEKGKLLKNDNIIYGLFSVTGFSSELITLSKKTNHLFLFNKNKLLL